MFQGKEKCSSGRKERNISQWKERKEHIPMEGKGETCQHQTPGIDGCYQSESKTSQTKNSSSLLTSSHGCCWYRIKQNRLEKGVMELRNRFKRKHTRTTYFSHRGSRESKGERIEGRERERIERRRENRRKIERERESKRCLKAKEGERGASPASLHSFLRFLPLVWPATLPLQEPALTILLSAIPCPQMSFSLPFNVHRCDPRLATDSSYI